MKLTKKHLTDIMERAIKRGQPEKEIMEDIALEVLLAVVDNLDGILKELKKANALAEDKTEKNCSDGIDVKETNCSLKEQFERCGYKFD